MGDVWIRTISQSLVRADRVTELATSRGSVHDDQGYSLKVVADGRASILIDNSDLVGTTSERLEHARRMEDALLLAMDAARGTNASVVISYEQDGERWIVRPASEVAGEIAP